MGRVKLVQVERFGNTFCTLSKFVVCFVFDIVECEGGYKSVGNETGKRMLARTSEEFCSICFCGRRILEDRAENGEALLQKFGELVQGRIYSL